MFKSATAFLFFMSVILVGCSSQQPANQLAQSANQSSQSGQELKTTRLHIDGFMKSKSGAI
jgi:predicted component of type VI protein secretion system